MTASSTQYKSCSVSPMKSKPKPSLPNTNNVKGGAATISPPRHHGHGKSPLAAVDPTLPSSSRASLQQGIHWVSGLPRKLVGARPECKTTTPKELCIGRPQPETSPSLPLNPPPFTLTLAYDAVDRRFIALPGRLEAFCQETRSSSSGSSSNNSSSRKPWEVLKSCIETALRPSVGRLFLGQHPLASVANSTPREVFSVLRRRRRRTLADTEQVLVEEQISVSSSSSPFLSSLEKDERGLAKNVHWNSTAFALLKRGDHAVAGALAGTVVSLCLHPIDTIKTVIQAQTLGHRSILHTIGVIMSDKGFSGLYRGMGSNLTASAPISAIYTFTYESIKSILIQHMPKEYHGLAHCTAGGCASIATSFVYTPSECVKQQMQVGSLYQNSWMAFKGILRTGGISTLYSGWGAILCRNIPQSVIKFYTYEALKNYALGGDPTDGATLTTFQSLAFGGLAGSTAALFTTPFDVIKTRLQTQVPGSQLYQKGVVQAFKNIAISEGFRGLYRGLIPRLVIYVSQGAIFFASYEFCKRIMALELQQFKLHSRQVDMQKPVIDE